MSLRDLGGLSPRLKQRSEAFHQGFHLFPFDGGLTAGVELSIRAGVDAEESGVVLG